MSDKNECSNSSCDKSLHGFAKLYRDLDTGQTFCSVDHLFDESSGDPDGE